MRCQKFFCRGTWRGRVAVATPQWEPLEITYTKRPQPRKKNFWRGIKKNFKWPCGHFKDWGRNPWGKKKKKNLPQYRLVDRVRVASVVCSYRREEGKVEPTFCRIHFVCVRACVVPVAAMHALWRYSWVIKSISLSPLHPVSSPFPLPPCSPLMKDHVLREQQLKDLWKCN